MNASEATSPSSRYPMKAMLRIVLVAALGAAVYSAISSPPSGRIGHTAATVQFKAAAGTGLPEPSSTATEGNVVDLTYPPAN